MQYVNVVTDDSVLVLNTENGEQVKFFKDDLRYSKAIELIAMDDAESVFGLDTKHIVQNFIQSDEYLNITITIKDGEGVVTLHEYGIEVPLHSAITNRIIKMSQQGLDSQPLINFISRLYDNPSKTAVEELYLFIEACELPITEDGCFIAYKIVRDDYMDIYTGKMDNSVGNFLSMPRHMVDDDRNNTCSAGLHFCSKEYLQHYGSSSRNSDRCLLVKIDPADVVSIPSDYNNAKGRTWQYEVVGEVEGNWRTWLPQKDFTDAAVVTSKAQPVTAPVEPTNTNLFKNGYADGYSDGKKHEYFQPRDYSSESDDEAEYNNGYDQGYKDGKGHKAKLIK